MIRVALTFWNFHESVGKSVARKMIYTLEEAENEWGYCVKDLTKRIEALKPGETFTDEAGDVWERLS